MCEQSHRQYINQINQGFSSLQDHNQECAQIIDKKEHIDDYEMRYEDVDVNSPQNQIKQYPRESN